jgi:hypothetical protein
MAIDTVVRNSCMIKSCWSPAARRMTVIANVAARNVRWVFTDRSRSVVTRDASPRYLGMINLIDG